MVKQGKYTLEKFCGVFSLSSESPSGLIWKVDAGKKKKGSIAGCKATDKEKRPKAWMVRYRGQMYQVHRIIWLLHKCELSDNLDIDHLDRNPFNNAIENLQPKPHRQNIQNRNIQRNNTSGRSGIVYVERERIKSTYRAWRTSWIDQYGKTKHKDFSIKIYGYDEARRLAENLRTQILHDLNTTGGQMYADDYF